MSLTALLHGHAWPLALAATVPAAALLALAGTLGARAAWSRAGLGAALAAAMLAATGLWWPAHWLAAPPAPTRLATLADAGSALHGWGLGLLLGITVTSGMAVLRQGRRPLSAAVMLGAVACAALFVQHTHGEGGRPAALQVAVLGAEGALLSGLLAALHVAPGAGTVAALWRAVMSTLGATLLTMTALQASLPAVSPPWTDLLGVTLLLALGVAGRLLTPTEAEAGAANAGQDGERPSQIPRLQPDTDALTQLPTRTYFEQRLGREVSRCDSHAGRLALLFIDLDGFKPVNDTFGHSSGDTVLEQVGERLKALAQHGNVVARVGGDEFLMLVPANPDVDGVSRLASRVIERLSLPYLIEGREVNISCSIGVVFYPDNGAHTKLIARADAAMYSAKRAGGSCYAFYTPEMDADAREQFDLLRDLRRALEADELELFYQPKIDARSGQVTAAEALLRWRHPTRGLVMPGAFIPVAERFGLIGAVGSWVIERAAQQAREWREQGLRMRVAINLSAQQLRQDDIVDRIVGALHKNRIQPSLFTCEITESVAMEDTRATQATLHRMGEAGLHLSIDDFGTGYSSLAYLRRLPAEELKIDRSFVKDVEQSNDARAVVDAVVKLAHALGLRVVAEGVETQRQQQILQAMGCDELQGYLFARPMSARALLLWALEDPQRDAFRPSLFGETLPVN